MRMCHSQRTIFRRGIATKYIQVIDFPIVSIAQSLHVDMISGATLTSKVYLLCVENVLLSAQKE